MAEVPDQLILERHRDLRGRDWHPWVRRLILVGLAAIVAAALLNAFGQHPTTSRADGAAAALEVQSPTRLRGGLIFEARFTVTAHRRIEKPTLVLQRGWFESMSINSIAPDPSQQQSSNGTVRLGFDPIEAGDAMTVWIYYQANPTNAGRRAQDVVLADGDQPLAQVERSATVFP